jgi:hypothetical protein
MVMRSEEGVMRKRCIPGRSAWNVAPATLGDDEHDDGISEEFWFLVAPIA